MTLTKEQFNKWSAALADGWKFDAQRFVIWGEKQIYTDSEPDARGVFYRATLEYCEERTGEGWTAQATGRQIPTIKIDRYTPTGTGALYSVGQIINEAAAEPENKKNYSVLAKLSASLDVSEYFKKAAEADAGKAYNDISDFAPAEAETAEEPETVEQTAETNEEAPETTTEEAAPDMFATLAAAYLGGKTIKAEPKKPAPQEPTAETEAEAPQEPPRIGYDEASDFFTAEETAQLSAGVPVLRKDRYNSAAYFTAPYSDDVKIIYRVDSYDERDRVNPGESAKFYGVLIGEAAYLSSARAISAKFTEDINRYLLEHVKSEEDAAHAAANVDDYQRGRINKAKERDYTNDARRAFFERKPPTLTLYGGKGESERGYEWDELISYLQSPDEAVEAAALRYLCDAPERVYLRYIEHNRLSAAYEAIKADTDNEEHKLLAISECVAEQKSVRVELSNGHEVRIEADAVKRIAFAGYISAWYVAACDRQYLNRNERGRDDDIKAADIVAIRHGGRVLYRAA